MTPPTIESFTTRTGQRVHLRPVRPHDATPLHGRDGVALTRFGCR